MRAGGRREDCSGGRWEGGGGAGVQLRIIEPLQLDSTCVATATTRSLPVARHWRSW